MRFHPDDTTGESSNRFSIRLMLTISMFALATTHWHPASLSAQSTNMKRTAPRNYRMQDQERHATDKKPASNVTYRKPDKEPFRLGDQTPRILQPNSPLVPIPGKNPSKGNLQDQSPRQNPDPLKPRPLVPIDPRANGQPKGQQNSGNQDPARPFPGNQEDNKQETGEDQVIPLLPRENNPRPDELRGQQNRAVVGSQNVIRDQPPTVQNHYQPYYWEMDLDEAFRIALINNTNIAVMGIEPDMARNNIRFSEFQWDPKIEANHSWAANQNRLASNIDTFGTGSNNQRNELYGQSAGRPDQLAISKRFKTGGDVRLSFSTGYNRSIPAGSFNTLNPTWRSNTTLRFVQPLAQGAGKRVNTLPVKIAKRTQQISDLVFESAVNQLIRDVEYAYWNMLFSHQNLEVRRKELEKARKVYEKELMKLSIGESSRPAVGEAKLAYYYSMNNYQARKAELIEDERAFRQLLGIQGFDDRRIYVKMPDQFPDVDVDWKQSLEAMFNLRPEIVSGEISVKMAKMQYELAKNQCLPNLNFESTLTKSGLAERLDDSLERMVDDPDYSWNVGFSYQRSVHRVREGAEVRRAQLQLRQAEAKLRQTRHDSAHRLQNSYSRLYQQMDKIAHMKNLREASLERLAAYEEKFELGDLSIELLLRARADDADMELRLRQAKVELMQSITDFEFVRGTLLNSRNIQIDGKKPRLEEAPDLDRGVTSLPDTKFKREIPRAPEFEDMLRKLSPEMRKKFQPKYDPTDKQNP